MASSPGGGPLSRALHVDRQYAVRGPAGRGADRRSALQAVPALLHPRRYAGPQPSHQNRRRTADRATNEWQRTSGSLRAISGESVKGGDPLSQDGKDQSELAAARRRRAREFRLPARSAGAVRKGGSPPTQPHFVSLPGSDAPLPNRSFAAVMKRGHWGVSGLFGGSQTFSTSCQASASETPLRSVR